MRLINLWLPEKHIEFLDNLVREGRYPNRSEAIRTAIRDLIKDESKTYPNFTIDESKFEYPYKQPSKNMKKALGFWAYRYRREKNGKI